MIEKTFQDIGSFYDTLVRQYGHDPRACNYGRPESQLTKFRILSEVADLSGKSVFEVGCGFADYCDFLNEKFAGVTYGGIDLSAEMAAKASALHPGAQIIHGNYLEIESHPASDFIFANGIFYLLGDNATHFMKELIRKMFENCGTGIAFNSLSVTAPIKYPNQFYADQAEVFAFCKTLTPWVTLRDDYMVHDFSVYMFREPRS